MSRRSTTSLVLSGGLVLAACASGTKLTATWRDPEAGPVDFAGRKVAAVVMTTDEANRRYAEAYLARELTSRGVDAVAGYSLVPNDVRGDKERARGLLEQAGVFGAVVMRPVGQKQELSQGPGYVNYWNQPYYGSFYSYYSFGWGAVYHPGYLKTENIVTVEIMVFDVEKDVLVWAGMSETTDPGKLGPFINELVTAAASAMRKEGLIRGR